MEEEFVSFEIAKKLKGKGFDEPCFAYYIPHDTTLRYNHNLCVRGIVTDCLYSHSSLPEEVDAHNFIDAPTISKALKWLREKHKLHIDIGIWDSKYIALIVYVDVEDDNIVHTNKTIYVNDGNYDSYEKAAIAGIEYILDNLI